MKGSDQVIDLLNEVLTAELTAINQYFADGKMCDNWGYPRLGARFRSESIDEMRDAEDLIERILYLDGLPNLQRLGPLRLGQNVPEKLTLALELEKAAVERLNRGIALCVDENDNGTRDLLQRILDGEEDHADWLETQLRVIAQIGEPYYLAQQIGDSGSELED